MKAPKHTVPTANHGASRCPRIASGRAGSRGSVRVTDLVILGSSRQDFDL
jgi:hypothetical protein